MTNEVDLSTFDKFTGVKMYLFHSHERQLVLFLVIL